MKLAHRDPTAVPGHVAVADETDVLADDDERGVALLGDRLVPRRPSPVLACWRFKRKPASTSY
jgi:hypothetical protein